MYLKKWADLPSYMRNEKVKEYYQLLEKKKGSLLIKRVFDVIMALLLLILLMPVFVIIAILIKKDSEGPVFYRQVRVTQYGQEFRIFKFRTMVHHADQLGAHVTLNKDSRITKVGEKIRNCRLDEIPQLINVLLGEMTFVGTRPEAIKYVKEYTPEMLATLLLPAGVTSEASIAYKDEAMLLDQAKDVDQFYVTQILPEKMKYNLQAIKKFSIAYDLKVIIKTIRAVI